MDYMQVSLGENDVANKVLSLTWTLASHRCWSLAARHARPPWCYALILSADVGVARHALRFDAMRTSELDRLAESARKILQEYDTKEEANRLASRVQSSMLQTAAFEIGAGERDFTLIQYY